MRQHLIAPTPVSQWVSDSFRFGDCHRISELCKLVMKLFSNFRPICKKSVVKMHCLFQLWEFVSDSWTSSAIRSGWFWCHQLKIHKLKLLHLRFLLETSGKSDEAGNRGGRNLEAGNPENVKSPDMNRLAVQEGFYQWLHGFWKCPMWGQASPLARC